MTAKWIDELQDIYADGGDWEDMFPILDRINLLLDIASCETDNEFLHDDVAKEIENVE
jgi:hypothetical protein